MNIINRSILAGAVVIAAISASGARADVIINVNGTQEADDTTNTFASFVGTVGGFNINSITASGVNAVGWNGDLLDVGTLDISSAGSGALTILVTETGLSLAGAQEIFGSTFTGVLSNITATRSFFLDPTNNGLETDSLGSVTGASGVFSNLESLSGPFSLTEEIDLTANAEGAKLS